MNDEKLPILWLRLDCEIGDTPEALAYALAYAAARIGMGVICNAIGVDMMALPGDRPRTIFKIWEQQMEQQYSKRTT